jgi:hypothetical protein
MLRECSLKTILEQHTDFRSGARVPILWMMPDRRYLMHDK